MHEIGADIICHNGQNLYTSTSSVRYIHKCIKLVLQKTLAYIIDK